MTIDSLARGTNKALLYAINFMSSFSAKAKKERKEDTSEIAGISAVPATTNSPKWKSFGSSLKRNYVQKKEPSKSFSMLSSIIHMKKYIDICMENK